MAAAGHELSQITDLLQVLGLLDHMDGFAHALFDGFVINAL
jgi:hypothetical protein